MSRHALLVVIRCKTPLSSLTNWLDSPLGSSHLVPFLGEDTGFNVEHLRLSCSISSSPWTLVVIGLLVSRVQDLVIIGLLVSRCLIGFVFVVDMDTEFRNARNDLSLHMNHITDA